MHGVSVRFGAYTAVQDVDLNVGDGEFLAVVGPTGCGKSTLLNVVSGLRPQSSGEVRILGREPNGINLQVGYLFQQDALMPWKTALDNVAAGLVFRGTRLREARERARPWLEKVGLKRFGDHYPHQLSGGMRKRVALAQTLILSPRVVLMDEPFSALDIQTRHLMENELLRLWQEDRKSVLFITHDLEEAISLADRTVVMSAGPAAHPVGDYPIGLPRPRDVAEIRLTQDFLAIHQEIWQHLRGEVMKTYER
jgi:NitT/TauT family transport system ATP-binding protein